MANSINTGKDLQIEIQSLVYGGDALGRLPDGRAVFVPFALPGETVWVEVIEEKARHARARLLEVLQPAPQRIQPRCLHFGVCGGCSYQHLTYEDQLEAKTGILREQLQRIAGITDPPIRPIQPSPSPWYYRNAVQFHLTEQNQLGYYEMHRPQVFAIRECHLPETLINDIWPALDVEAVAGVERVELRCDMRDEALMVLEGQALELPEMELDMPLSVVHHSPAGPIVMAGEGDLVYEVLGRRFLVSSTSFFQVNTPMAAEMVQHLLDELPLKPDSTVLDVYCGVGLFSAFLAPRVARVIGIELAESAVEDFAANLDEFDNVEIYQGPAEVVLPDLQVKADVIVVDPPRAGLERAALDALVEMRAPVLAYVSCDQATLARDAKRLLRGGYRLAQITPFDLFPQTAHIESISLFVHDTT